MNIRRFRWHLATVLTAAVLAVTVVFTGGWGAEAAENPAVCEKPGGWALVNMHFQQVIAVYGDDFTRFDLYENHSMLRLVKIPADVCVVPHHTSWNGVEFVAKPWGWWWPTSTPTPTPAPGGTGIAPTPAPTLEPIATAGPSTPTPTPTPGGLTLESQVGDLWAAVTALQADRDAKQLVIQELRGRIDAIEAQLATPTPAP